VYIADFLRTFAGGGVDGLLLDEGATPEDGLVHPEAYRSVLNVADHYEWPVLVRTDAAPVWPHGDVAGVAVWLAPAARDKPAHPWGIVAGAELWDGADPEAVMQRVRALT